MAHPRRARLQNCSELLQEALTDLFHRSACSCTGRTVSATTPALVCAKPKLACALLGFSTAHLLPFVQPQSRRALRCSKVSLCLPPKLCCRKRLAVRSATALPPRPCVQSWLVLAVPAFQSMRCNAERACALLARDLISLMFHCSANHVHCDAETNQPPMPTMSPSALASAAA